MMFTTDGVLKMTDFGVAEVGDFPFLKILFFLHGVHYCTGNWT